MSNILFLGIWIGGIVGITLYKSNKKDKIEIMSVRKELKKVRLLDKADRESIL